MAQSRRSFPSWLWISLLALGIIVALVVAGFAVASLAKTPVKHHYSATIQAHGSRTEVVGRSATIEVLAKNTGKTIPDLVLWFHGLNAWSIPSPPLRFIHTPVKSMKEGIPITASPVSVSGEGQAYWFGRLAAHDTAVITVTLLPKTAGSHVLSLNAYAKIHGSGLSGSSAPIKGGPDLSQPIATNPTSWSIKINP